MTLTYADIIALLNSSAVLPTPSPSSLFSPFKRQPHLTDRRNLHSPDPFFMNENNQTLTGIQIWQQNLNNSPAAQLLLINGPVANQWDILALQEPTMDQWLGLTKDSSHWRVVYPTHKFSQDTRPRAISLINAKISTNSWKQIPFPSRDVVITQFTGTQETCTIFNIYNNSTNNRTIEQLEHFLATSIREVCPSESDHMFWLGDFNRHHPLWDEERNSHLLTRAALNNAQKLLDLVADYSMSQALPKDLPTLKSSSMGNWTRPDNIFCMNHSLETLMLCITDPDQRGPKTDHVPILTHLDLNIPLAPDSDFRNYCDVDWGEFDKYLCDLLSKLPPPHQIEMKEDFQRTARELDEAL